MKRLAVKEFACLHRCVFAHRHHGSACLGHIVEIYHCRCGARHLGFCVEACLADEGEGAFTTYHAVGDDVVGVVEENEGQYVESRDVFYGIFVAYESRQFGVLPYLVAYRPDFCKQCFVCVGECLARCLVGSVEHGAVGEDDAYVAQYSVTVGVGAAFHAGGVVGYDAAYHGCLFGGGVGRKDAAVGGENLVYARTSDTRLQGYGLGFGVEQTVFVPEGARDYENRI